MPQILKAGKKAFALSEELFKSVSSYIDENYIDSKTLDECGTEGVYAPRLETRRIREPLKQRNRIHEGFVRLRHWKSTAVCLLVQQFQWTPMIGGSY